MTTRLTEVSRAGTYLRLAEPTWDDPLDTAYAARTGGRWNAVGDPLLHLNRSLRLARLQADHKLRGQPFGIEDLDPDLQHDLVELEVDELRVQDCVTDAGLAAAGLPATYPLDAARTAVGWEQCQSVGSLARQEGLDGVACRTAVTNAEGEEELAVFEPPASVRVRQTSRLPFRQWYFEEGSG